MFLCLCVCELSIKESETRDGWWLELRNEVRSHARAVNCNTVMDTLCMVCVSLCACVWCVCVSVSVLSVCRCVFTYMYVCIFKSMSVCVT